VKNITEEKGKEKEQENLEIGHQALKATQGGVRTRKGMVHKLVVKVTNYGHQGVEPRKKIKEGRVGEGFRVQRVLVFKGRRRFERKSAWGEWERHQH